MIQFEVPKTHKKVIAIDFDGTIVENAFPNIGEPIKDVVAFIKRHRHKYTWILWTCRTGEYLQNAVEFLNNIGITMDYVNSNTKEYTERYGDGSRKIYADYYIDDKNISISELKRHPAL